MNDFPLVTHSESKRVDLIDGSDSKNSGPGAVGSLLTPLDPIRQAKRLPIRVIKMLTAHTGHLLHPEYLQPLTSAPVSIEVFTVFAHIYGLIFLFTWDCVQS